MATINAEKPMPFYKQVVQLSLLFCTALIMLAAATALTMELAMERSEVSQAQNQAGPW